MFPISPLREALAQEKHGSNGLCPNSVSTPPPQANGRIVGTIFRLYLDRFCTLEFLQDLKKCIEYINKARTGPKQDILKHWLVPQKHLNTHQYNKALSLNGSLFRDPGPYRDLYGIWVLIGSLFIFLGPYFQCFGLIHAKNVNSVCMYTTMSYLDLSVMSNDLHCYYTYVVK